jgi:uncharacterized protein YbaR (Trm112 family)
MKEIYVGSEELLRILRCPSCVSEGPDSGHLERVGKWLVCADCERAYPIRDDIPVMLIDEGDRYRGIPPEELPETPPLEISLSTPPAGAVAPAELTDKSKVFLVLVGLLLGAGLVLLWVNCAKRRRAR